LFKGKPTGEHEQHNANNLFHNWSAGRYLQTPPLKSSAGIVNSGAPLFFARSSSFYPAECEHEKAANTQRKILKSYIKSIKMIIKIIEKVTWRSQGKFRIQRISLIMSPLTVMMRTEKDDPAGPYFPMEWNRRFGKWKVN
jgi:hypothetical protein